MRERENVPLFEKSGAKTFIAVSPFCLTSRQRTFSLLFRKFSRGLGSLLQKAPQRSFSQTLQPLFLWSHRRKEKAKQKETPIRDFALCGARQGLRVLDRAAFEKAGETFMAISPVCLTSRRRTFSPLFQKFLRVSGTFFKKFLTVPPKTKVEGTLLGKGSLRFRFLPGNQPPR